MPLNPSAGRALLGLLFLCAAAPPLWAGGPRVPLLSDAEAWRHLPAAEEGAGKPLPAWARALAAALPRTTAAMLELDYLQRTKSPLGPALRAKMRWVAAKANESPYGMVYAEADWRRAGASESEVAKLVGGDWADYPSAEAAALRFARKLTLEGAAVTDGELAELRRAYGDSAVVGMVLLLAYANFQDRLVLALGLPVEEGGPLPPLAVRFRQPFAGGAEPVARAAPTDRPERSVSLKPPGAEWSQAEFDKLQSAMQSQKARPGRITVPTWTAVRQVLPPGYPVPQRPTRIRWSLVCMGYQPELAAAWGNCLRTFAQDSKQDRVFEESLFWVVTRSIDCFY
jgi:alkylhydroperoxidase family enzyme